MTSFSSLSLKFSTYMRLFTFVVPLLSISASSRAVPFILSTEEDSPLNSTSSSSDYESPLSTSNTKYIAQEPDLTDFNSGIFALSSATQHARAYPLPFQNASNSDQDYRASAGGTSKRDQLGSDSGLLQWTLKNTNGSVQIPALAPSQIHLDLLRAGIIPDMNVGLNEGTARWIIDEPTWTYTADMSPVLEKMKEKGYTESLLWFQGLDSISTIYLGDKKIGDTDNQFRHWIFNSTDAISSIKGGNKNLTLVFHNPVDYAYAESAQEPYFPDQNTAPDSAAIDIYEYSRRNFIRKQQSDFGWDWGPAYVPRGIHKPAYLIALEPSSSSTSSSGSLSNETSAPSRVGKSDSIFVYETSVDIYRKDQRNNLSPNLDTPWVVNVSLSIQSTRDFESPTLSMDFSNTSFSSGALNLSSSITKGDNDALFASFEVPSNGSDAPELWFPSVLGDPKLYDLNLVLVPDSSQRLRWSRRTGFRTIVLNQEEYSKEEIAAGFAPGSKFHFEINGQIINTPGSNIIPMDTLYARVSTDVLEWTISSAMAAGQNLLRVWGGASYQSTQFYDITSEKGILVWSEVIFACSMAPTYDSFVENVRKEVLQNVRRINSQPSNALWAGNNEGEGFMLTVRDALKNGSIYEEQYNYMFNEVIRSAVLQSTSAISYIPSSTTHGYTSLEPYVPRYLNKTEGAVYGDLELYQYDPTQAFNVSGYQVGRYVNEFGMHSLPSIYSLDAVLTEKEAFRFNSTEVRAHNKHSPAGSLEYPFPADDGQFQMTAPVELYLGKPIDKEDPRETLAQWAYSTQVHQAAMISNEILFYRLGSGRPERNLGGVYWQLADNWQGATWASIEYGGRWKVMHYLAARTQDRVTPFPLYHIGNKSLELHVISDDLESAAGKATWTWYTFAGKKLASNSTSFQIKGINTTLITSSIPSETYGSNAFLHFTVNGTRSKNSRFCQEAFFSPIAIKDASLRDPKISIKLLDSIHDDSDSTAFEISNNGDSVAPWTWIEHPEGVLGWFESEETRTPSNAFWLRPGEKRVLNFRQAYDRTDGDWKNGLKARSIWDNTH